MEPVSRHSRIAETAGVDPMIFPLLVRYPEVRAGGIDHALRVTAARTQRAYVHPATHFASSSSDPSADNAPGSSTSASPTDR